VRPRSSPACRRALVRGLGAAGFEAKIIEQFRPHRLQAVEAIQGTEHGRVTGAHGQCLPEHFDGPRAVREIVLVGGGRARQQGVLQVGVVLTGQLDALHVQLDEALRVLLRFVQLGQAIDGERALRIELERSLVGHDGALGIVEHVTLGFTDAAPHAGALAVVQEQVGLVRQHLDQRGPITEQRRQLLHLLERLEIRSVGLVQQAVGGQGAPRVVALLVVNASERRVQLALAR
jgi:hypothetical protein